METFVKTVFQPLMEKAENLDAQIPKLADSEVILNQMHAHWNSSKDIHVVKLQRWIGTTKAMYQKLTEARKNPILLNALHELIVSILFTAIESPKRLLNHYECMGSLGSVTMKLKKYCDWDSKMFQAIEESHVSKNTTLYDPKPYEAFFQKEINKENGPFARVVLADIFIVTVDTDFWQHKWRNKHLDQFISLFNSQDATEILIASELADLHLSTKGQMRASLFTK